MDKKELFDKMKDFSNENDGLPDGAFFALAEEQGIQIEDWEWYADECQRRAKQAAKS